MTLENMSIWLILGLVPYRIHKQHLPGGLRSIEIHALFWTLIVKQRPSKRNDWVLHIPLIENMRRALWVVVVQFKDNKMDATVAEANKGATDD